MDQSTQATAAQMEELSGTATSLSSQSEQLQAVVEQFHLNRDTKQELKKGSNLASQLSSNRRKQPLPAKRKSNPVKVPNRRGEQFELVGAGADGFEEF
jgi:hypothetical protein